MIQFPLTRFPRHGCQGVPVGLNDGILNDPDDFCTFGQLLQSRCEYQQISLVFIFVSIVHVMSSETLRYSRIEKSENISVVSLFLPKKRIMGVLGDNE
jgi:hypothetical protein